MSLRWILHLDMDAFFASIEQLDNPCYVGKPIIVGGGLRGVVSTCSYEARKYGVHSAMPIYTAKKLCPRGIFVTPRIKRYKEKSKEVMNILTDFSPLVEQSSIDEAYLDITGLGHIFSSVNSLMIQLQKRIFKESGLTCSVGVAPVKFLSKIMSDFKKPGGLSILTYDKMDEFLKNLPVKKIPGVGKRTSKILEKFGVVLCSDVLKYSQEFWEQKLGKAGLSLYKYSCGIDERPVVTYTPPKSESAENTLKKDTLDMDILTKYLYDQSERVSLGLRASGFKGRTITLKIKYSNFTLISKSLTISLPTSGTKKIFTTAKKLLDQINLVEPVRLIGVGVSNFMEQSYQYTLFPEEVLEEQDEYIDKAMDSLKSKFGDNILARGISFEA